MPRALKLCLMLAVAWLCAFEVEAHPASGVVVDRAGRVYFSDLETVWRLDARGALRVFRPGVRGRHVHELTVDDGGNVYGADLTYEPGAQRWVTAVWRRTRAGVETYLVAPTERPPRGAGVVRDAQGNAYAVEQDNHTKRETLLLKRTPGGEVSVLAGGAYGHADGKGASARFGSVVALALGRDGTLYLTDGAAVRRVWPDGTVRTIGRAADVKHEGDARTGADHHSGFYGLTADADGRVFVADHGRRRVLRFAPGGAGASVLRSEPPWSPTGVAVDKDGLLYVLEVGPASPAGVGTRVRRLAPDGSVRLLATVNVEGGRSLEHTDAAAGEAEPRVAPLEDERATRPRAAQTGAFVLYLGLGALAIAAVAGLRLLPRRGL